MSWKTLTPNKANESMTAFEGFPSAAMIHKAFTQEPITWRFFRVNKELKQLNQRKDNKREEKCATGLSKLTK